MRIAMGAATVIALVAAATGAKAADEVADFYTGKQIHIIVGQEAGTGYDVLARAVSRFMGKHIPGNPSFVVQNMVGAGTRLAANHLYNVAPRDGTVLGVIAQSMPMDQAMAQEGIQFDVARFNWIGTPMTDNQVTAARSDTGVETIADIKTKGLICGGPAGSNAGIIYPQIINNLTDSKIQIISGYAGTPAINMALEKNEINCFGSNTWSSVKVQLGHLLKDKKLNILLQWGLDNNPAISEYQGRTVPIAVDLARNDADRKVLALINSSTGMGRPLFAPPDVPAARVEALRRGFDRTMKDPEFISEAEKLQVEVTPKTGETLQKLATEVSRTPPDLIELSKKLIEPKDVKTLGK
jgi:tripartite-type tricarboxylate transporter receptor subunit TctC